VLSEKIEREAPCSSSDPGDSGSAHGSENRPIDELLQILGLALVSMLNPTLLAALTVILLTSDPRRLMVGYLLGALTASIASGLIVVFALEGSGATEAGKKTIGPAEDLLLGVLLLLVAFVLRGGGRAKRRPVHGRGEAEGEHRDSLPIRLLGRGSARIAFAVGVVLSFPGASYLVGLTHIDRFGAATATTVALVVGFCIVQLLLLELPLLGYLFAPQRTADAVRSFRSWLTRSGRRVGSNVAAVLGALLLVRAAIVVWG
jgi:hypothetical protein